MEYVGLLKRVDDEDVGETWLDALIAQFDFPSNPQLFHHLTQVNQRLENIAHSLETCGCSLPPTQDFWIWTKGFPVDKTKVMILNGAPHVNLTAVQLNHLLDQGVLVLTHYVDPDCRRKGIHQDWQQILVNLVHFMVNNFPQVQYIIDGEESAETFGPLVQNPQQRLQGSNIVANLFSLSSFSVSAQLEECNQRLIKSQLDPISWSSQ